MWMTSDWCGFSEMGLEGFKWMWRAWVRWGGQEIVVETLHTHLKPTAPTQGPLHQYQLAIYTHPRSSTSVPYPPLYLSQMFLIHPRPSRSVLVPLTYPSPFTSIPTHFQHFQCPPYPQKPSMPIPDTPHTPKAPYTYPKPPRPNQSPSHPF